LWSNSGRERGESWRDERKRGIINTENTKEEKDQIRRLEYAAST
jgi:hypothetical protein